MISMLCQKSKQGAISPHDRTLFNYLLYGDDSNSVFRTNEKFFEKSFYGVDANETNTLTSTPHSNTNHFINHMANNDINNINENVNKSGGSRNMVNESPDIVLFKRVSRFYILSDRYYSNYPF